MSRPRHLLSAPACRRWITALALLAFFLQNLAVQTHVHPSLQSAVKVQAGDTHKGPLKLDPVDQCRLCQELTHSGTFIAPLAVAAFAGLTFVTASFIVWLVCRTDPAAAFAWQSRAPPRR